MILPLQIASPPPPLSRSSRKRMLRSCATPANAIAISALFIVALIPAFFSKSSGTSQNTATTTTTDNNNISFIQEEQLLFNEATNITLDLLEHEIDPVVAKASLQSTTRLLSALVLGVLAARYNILTPATIDALAKLTYGMFEPCLMLTSVAHTLLRANTNGGLGKTILFFLMPLASLVHTIVGYITGRTLTSFMPVRSQTDARDVWMCTTFANSVTLPLVFTGSLFHQSAHLQADVTACISFYLLLLGPLFYTYGTPMLLTKQELAQTQSTIFTDNTATTSTNNNFINSEESNDTFEATALYNTNTGSNSIDSGNLPATLSQRHTSLDIDSSTPLENLDENNNNINVATTRRIRRAYSSSSNSGDFLFAASNSSGNSNSIADGIISQILSLINNGGSNINYTLLLKRMLAAAMAFGNELLNPPVLGACLGVIVGLVPILQQVFLTDDGLGAPLFGALQTFGTAFVPSCILILSGSMSAATGSSNTTNSAVGTNSIDNSNNNDDSATLSSPNAIHHSISNNNLYRKEDSAHFDDAAKPLNEHMSLDKVGLTAIMIARFVVFPIATAIFLSAIRPWLADESPRNQAIVSFVIGTQGVMPPAQNSVLLLHMAQKRDRATRMTRMLTVSYLLSVLPVTLLMSHVLSKTNIMVFAQD